MSEENKGRRFSRRRFLKSSVGAAGFVLASMAKPPSAGAEEKEGVKEEMIEVPKGEFIMGTSEEEIKALCEKHRVARGWFEPEAPKRKVSLETFRIGKYSVTNAQYEEFVKATGHQPSPHWGGKTCPPGIRNHPVVMVRYADAEAYAKWAGKKLPTEEQWEKAAGGPDGLIYPWGNEWDPERCNFNSEPEKSLGRGPSPVDAYPNGASPYGVWDMVGNVMEWTMTKWGNSRVIKGGAWVLTQPYNMRCAMRSYTRPVVNSTNYLGFRVVE